MNDRNWVIGLVGLDSEIVGQTYKEQLSSPFALQTIFYSMDIYASLVVIATFVTLASIVTMRPNLRATTVIVKKAAFLSPNGLAHHQFMVSVSVENNGVFPIRYTVRNRTEELHRRKLDYAKNEQLPLALGNGKRPDVPSDQFVAIYEERVFNIAVPKHIENLKSKLVLGYDVEHFLSSGDKTSDAYHIVGNATILDSQFMDYSQSLENPMWLSYVKIEPAGFWGLPIIRKLNTRTIQYSSSSLLALIVNKL